MANIDKVTYTIEQGKYYESNYDGKYKIIEFVGNNKYGSFMVNIQFENTGNIQTVRFSDAINGSVKDWDKTTPIIGKIYQSNNFGPFIFIEYAGRDKKYNKPLYKIKFLDTGNEEVYNVYQALNGTIKDHFKPIVCGFGYIGYGKSNCKEYKLWHNMIVRCYDKNSPTYQQYGAKGVTVCDRWRSYETFYEDIKDLDGYDEWKEHPDKYQLDKDSLQMDKPENEKVYSPETCCFLHEDDNIARRTQYQATINGDNYTSKYFCVDANKKRTRFTVTTRIFGDKKSFGVYDDEIVAANVYNNVIKTLFGPNPRRPLNDVMYIDKSEISNHCIKPNILCRAVKDDVFCKVVNKKKNP